MVYINSFSGFSDPFISPDQQVTKSEFPEIIVPVEPGFFDKSLKISRPQKLDPIIAKTISALPDESIIVYRGPPRGFSAGPNIDIPDLNLNISNGSEHSQVHVSCTSTYPDGGPYNPIADRYEVRLFRDGWILALADGCGLQLSSRLAPKAAMEGFWSFLTDRIQNDQDRFRTQKLAHYLHEAIQAGHLNIYWDAYLRNQDGYSAHKIEVMDQMKAIQGHSEELDPLVYQTQHDEVSSQLNRIIDALKGDRISQRKLIEADLSNGFYENYAGATTFLCSALVKGGSHAENPYYLLSVSLGDCKGYLFRDGHIQEITKDNREDISNARDPGGKIGYCNPVPLVVDNRNLQYSLTPCMPKDILYFMTDGVIDNVDPERIGLLPNARLSSNRALHKLTEASGLSDGEIQELLGVAQINASSWDEVPLEEANAIKNLFGQKLLEKMIQKSNSPKEANERISTYCHRITSEHRDQKPHFLSFFDTSSQPIGKPDHTTVMTIEIPAS